MGHTTVLSLRYTTCALLYVVGVRGACEWILVARIVGRVVPIVRWVATVGVRFATRFGATGILRGRGRVIKVKTDFVIGAVGPPAHVGTCVRCDGAIEDDLRRVRLCINGRDEKSGSKAYLQPAIHHCDCWEYLKSLS